LEKFERISKKIVKSVSSAACGGLATPARRPHPPRFRKSRLEQDKIVSDFAQKNAKILKTFLNLNGTPVVTSSDDSLLTSVPLKKSSAFCWLHF
jgi:hypothetical protein